MKSTKILELSEKDWMKGLSAHAGIPIGGIFQTATEFDPFSLPGYLRASISPTDVDNTTLSTQINSLCSYGATGVGYVIAVGNRASGGAKCVYLINTATNAVTDEKANVGSGLLLGGCIAYGDYLLYGDGTNGAVRSVVLPAFSSDTGIEVPSNWQDDYQPCVFRFGPSGYVHYFRGVANGEVGVITVPGSNHANNTSDSVIIQNNLTPKDGVSDGRYFIIIGDNNPSQATGLTADCKVFFTVPAFSAGAPVSTTTWEVAYSIPDQYLIAIRYVAGRTYVIGYSGIWEVGIGMAPQLVMPLTPSQLPLNPYCVDVQKNLLVWQGKATGARVYGFGHAFNGKPILYTPYDSDSSTRLGVALCVSGDYLYAGLDDTGASTKVVAHNWGSTRANTTIQTIVQHLPQPHSLSKVKVTLKKPLASGEEVEVRVFNANDEAIMDQNSKTFTGVGAFRTLLFDVKPASTGALPSFENFYLQISAVGGAIVDRVQVWAIPEEPLSQTK